ncbi:MAG: SoxR reducing system RseC family protein [Melioribacteraceae bacterium]|nr:SoxR reducing system RseC family protein [Melioribacteraceae bacterium]
MSELLIEEGIVISSKNGFADIEIMDSANCDKCSAKIICKPSDSERRRIKVIDPYNVGVGDFVKISIEGFQLVKASFLLYGMPLIILLTSLLTFLNYYKMDELVATLLSMGLTAIYFFIVYSLREHISPEKLPKIISVKKTTLNDIADSRPLSEN